MSASLRVHVRRELRRDHRREDQGAEHPECREKTPAQGHRRLVAIADRGHRHGGPPEAAGEPRAQRGVELARIALAFGKPDQRAGDEAERAEEADGDEELPRSKRAEGRGHAVPRLARKGHREAGVKIRIAEIDLGFACETHALRRDRQVQRCVGDPGEHRLVIDLAPFEPTPRLFGDPLPERDAEPAPFPVLTLDCEGRHLAGADDQNLAPRLLRGPGIRRRRQQREQQNGKRPAKRPPRTDHSSSHASRQTACCAGRLGGPIRRLKGARTAFRHAKVRPGTDLPHQRLHIP